MRYLFTLTSLLAVLAVTGAGCGRDEDADVPVIDAATSQPPTPETPDDPEPVRLELPAEAGTDSFAAADPADVDTLSSTEPQRDSLRRATRDQQLVDLASLQPVGSARDVPAVPTPPSLAAQLQSDQPLGSSKPRLAPLPEPDVPPVTSDARTAEVPRPAYAADDDIPTPAQAAPPPNDAEPEPATTPPARRRRLGWEPRPNPLAGLDMDAPAEAEPVDPETTNDQPANQALPAREPAVAERTDYDDGPAPTPLTSIITDDDMAASVDDVEEPEDTGPAAEKAADLPPVARRTRPQPKMFTEKIVAGMTLKVNQQSITVDEVLAALHGELASIPENVSRQTFRSEVERIVTRRLLGLIQQILVYEEAQQLMEDPLKRQIDAEMDETLRDLVANAGGSLERLKAQIRQEGMTLDALLDAHRRQLTVRTYMRYKFVPAIVITRRMLWDYYRRHEDDYRTETRVQMQIIAAPFEAYLPKSSNEPTEEERAAAVREARRVIERAMEQLQKGDDFGKIARQYSEGIKAEVGGTWPKLSRGSFAEMRVEDAAWELDEGEFSEIVETETGYYIVRAREVEKGTMVSFEDAQSDIRRAFQDEQLAKLRGEYMRKLYQNATISQPDEFIRLAIERAVERYWR